MWITPHGVVLVDMASQSTVGLARLAVRPLVEELQRVLDESALRERGGGLLH